MFILSAFSQTNSLRIYFDRSFTSFHDKPKLLLYGVAQHNIEEKINGYIGDVTTEFVTVEHWALRKMAS